MRNLKLILTFAIILLAITACGKNNRETTEPTPHVSIIGGWQQDDPPERIRGNIHHAQDFGGRTITIASAGVSRLQFMMLEPAFIEQPDPATSQNYRRDRLIWDNARRVEREFNIVIEEQIFNYTRFRNLLASSVAAGHPFADIVYLHPSLLLESVAANQLYPLCTIDLPASDLFSMQIYTQFTAEAFGRAWAFNANVPYTNAFTLGVNMDIIRAIGAPSPVELYYAGAWTWDVMLDIMRAATRDTTGGDTINQWGIIGEPDQLLMNFIGANDGVLVTEDFKHGFYSHSTFEALEFMETIMGEGLWRLNREMHMVGGRWLVYHPLRFEAVNPILQGNAAFLTWPTFANTPSGFTSSALPFEIAIVPLPTGPSNTTGSTGMIGFRDGFAFPHGLNWNTADLLTVMEEFLSWPGHEPDLLNDITVRFGGLVLEDDNATRHLYAAHTKRFDIGVNVPQFAYVRANYLSGITSGLDLLVLSMSNWNSSPSSAYFLINHSDGWLQSILDRFFEQALLFWDEE